MHYDINIDPDVFLPCYRHLQDDADVDIDFIYGSRDSGKSRDTAQRLVIKCLTAPYFRHILARKTFNTIQDSQWQLIKDVVQEWNLDSLFTFRKNPLGIDCINGNRFIARGFDDPAQIKSTQNPSGAWVEEGNQLTKEDWVTLITSLRSNEGKIKVDITFNPETDGGDYRDFWLYKDHFKHTADLSFVHHKKIKVADKEHTLVYRATHTTYHDNPFCSPQRKAEYEDLKITSPYHYRIYGLGLWGNRENKSPFVLTFIRDRHLGHTEFNPEQPLYLSFDFNRNPMCCNVIQWDGDIKLDWIEIIKLPNSTIYTMCDVIKIKYPGALYIVCGDGSGSARSAMVQDVDLNSYYKIIQQELEASDRQMQFCVNPRIEDNQVLINWCFQHLDITINPDTCQPLIFDLEFAEMMANGQLKKSDREDPAQQLDSLDGCFSPETIIQTERGNRAIDQVKVGDKVITPKGSKMVIDKFPSKKFIYEFTFSDGTKIKCTKDHKFFTQNAGYISILDIFIKKLLVCKRQFTTTEEATQKTRNSHIITPQIQETQKPFIAKSGSIILDLFLMAIIFITRMRIRITTTLKTLRLRMAFCTSGITALVMRSMTHRGLKSLPPPEGSLPKNGTHRQTDLSGIANTLLNVISATKPTGMRPVETVKSNSLNEAQRQSFVQTIVSQHGEEKTIQITRMPLVRSAKGDLSPLNIYPKDTVPKNADQPPILTELSVVSVSLIGKGRVYDITIADEHCFYAEGFQVHNCRYFFNRYFSKLNPLN